MGDAQEPLPDDTTLLPLNILVPKHPAAKLVGIKIP